jgi:predicted metal-dependent hydrolase
MRVLEIGNLIVEVVKKDIKNLHLAVYPPDGRVRLAAPANVNDDTLRLFTISKLGWIRRQQRKFASQDRQPERKYVQRESHYYLGKRYLLRVIEQEKPSKVVLKNKTYIDLYCKPGTSKESMQYQLEEWYRAQLKTVIAELMEPWEKKIGVEIEDWGVRKMRTKWAPAILRRRRSGSILNWLKNQFNAWNIL